jgi:hypothetical protein
MAGQTISLAAAKEAVKEGPMLLRPGIFPVVSNFHLNIFPNSK